MYTKEDKGIEVFHPSGRHYEVGEVFNESSNPLLTFQLDELTRLYMDAEGYEVDHLGYRLSVWAIFSRDEYEPGKPFVCVTERPEPVWDPELGEPVILAEGRIGFVIDIDHTRNFPYRVQITKMYNDLVHINGMRPYSLETARKILGIEPTNPYPKVQPSGKIRVDTPEQSETVQKFLFSIGYKWSGEHTRVPDPNRLPFLFWNTEQMEVSFGDSDDFRKFDNSEHPEHSISHFGITPPVEGETEAFGPSEDIIDVYDQFGNSYGLEWDEGNKFGRIEIEQKYCADIMIEVYPSGNTSTPIKLTRENPTK